MHDSGFVDVPNARLYYEVAGGGPAVVFVHSFTLDTRMWDDQWTVFGERYRVVRYDLRGFGRSEAEPVPYSDLDDLLALLNCLDIERAHLVGLSMGGMVIGGPVFTVDTSAEVVDIDGLVRSISPSTRPPSPQTTTAVR